MACSERGRLTLNRFPSSARALRGVSIELKLRETPDTMFLANSGRNSPAADWIPCLTGGWPHFAMPAQV
jgi:hypothetical protein